MYFAASLAPRMEQAASHIQDSRDLSLEINSAIQVFFSQQEVGCVYRFRYYARIVQNLISIGSINNDQTIFRRL